MKKLLLIITILAFTFNMNAQKVWNFSNAPFGPTPTAVFTSTFVFDALTVATDGTALWTLDGSGKTIDGVTYTQRLKSGGGGSPVTPSKIPVTRYLSINVSGVSELKFAMMSSSSTATRTLILVNEGETFLDSIVNISGSAAATYTYNYTGAATKLYFYSRASGLNFYSLSATNVLASTPNLTADKGVIFDGSKITNDNNLSLEVYNVLGKMIASSTTAIDTDNFAKGVYVARSKGVNGVLKFSK